MSVEAAQRFSNPLWVIDGVPMYSFTSPVSGLTHWQKLIRKDIESVQLGKMQPRLQFMVPGLQMEWILVTTKKGRYNQKARVSVNVSQTLVFNPALPDLTGGNRERLSSNGSIEKLSRGRF